MTKQSFPFDGVDVMEAQWSQMARQWLNSGVFSGYLNELAVYGDATGMQVKVKTGGGWIQGHYYSSDAEETLAIQAAHGSLNRIDRVVLYVDWGNNVCNTRVLTGTAAASPSAPALTQNTSVWEISLAQVYVGAAVSTITAGNVTDERSFAVNSIPDGYQTNNSGGALVVGAIVVRDTSITAGFKTTTRVGDPSICGILTQAVGSGAKTRLTKIGLWPVLTTGVVTMGHYLVASATPGYAQDSGSIQKPTVGGIGIAVGSSAGGLALVLTDVDINIYTSSAILQQMPSTTYSTPSAGVTHTFTHYVDSGTDLLIIFVGNLGNVAQISVTANGTGMAQAANVRATYGGAGLYSMKNPPTGSVTIVVTMASSDTVQAFAANFIGSQATPLRTVSTGTGSLGPVSAVGDIVIEINQTNDATLPTQTSGQTVMYANIFGSSRGINCAKINGAAGNTTCSWSAYYEHIAVAIAGS